MTSYFDDWDAQLIALERAHPTIWTAGEAIHKLEAKLVYDVTVATECDRFPADLRNRVNAVVRMRAVYCRTVNDMTNPRVDEPADHYRELARMSHDLHTIFHRLAERRLDGFSDSPLSPLRVLFSRSEERRERLAAQEQAHAAHAANPAAAPAPIETADAAHDGPVTQAWLCELIDRFGDAVRAAEACSSCSGHTAETRDAAGAEMERARTEAFDALDRRLRDGLTHAEILVACSNVGIDLTCGACAAVFYTNVGMPQNAHTCDRDYEQSLRDHEHDLHDCGHALGAHEGYGDTPTIGKCKHCQCDGQSGSAR